MSLGYAINYPPGCKELDINLKADELRRRLNELSNALDKIIDADSFADDTVVDIDDLSLAQKNENLRGLFLLVSSPEFRQYPDSDVQARVAVCICKMMRIFCPINPYFGMLEEQALTKSVLTFLLDCIGQLANLKSKSDVLYPKLHTVLYICCQIDAFIWCTAFGDEVMVLDCVKTTFLIIKNIAVWAWTEVSLIRQMLLDMLVKVIVQAENLLSRDIITFLLQLLIEPAKSTQPEQHTLARDLILRTATHLEYPIQMLLQSALIAGSGDGGDKQSDIKASDTSKPEGSNIKETSAGSSESSSDASDSKSTLLAEHSFLIIYALHTIQDSIVAPILPTVELKLKSPSTRERKRSFRLLARLFSEPQSLLHEQNPGLWEAFLGRFNDIDKEVRKLCVHMVPQLLKQNSSLPQERLLACLQQRVYDPAEDVRLLVLRTMAVLVSETQDGVTDNIFSLLEGRSRDKNLSIRKEASTALASIYKRSFHGDHPPKEKLTSALNTILHMYYHPSVEDRIVVERLFKSSIVPYHLDTRGRVKALFTCYALADEASIRALQELFKVQYTALCLLRDVVHFLAGQEGKKITVPVGVDLMDRIYQLANLLPKSEKSLEHLKRFFNVVHTDKALGNQLAKLTKPFCSCSQATSVMRELLKRVTPVQGSANASENQLSYARCVKILLERSAPVLFDREFGQEVLTQLVVLRETGSLSEASGPMSIVCALRLLWALSVYFRKILPVDEVVDYVVTVLSEESNSTIDALKPVDISSVPSTTRDPDPPTAQELCLNILCCILGGSNSSVDSDLTAQQIGPLNVNGYFTGSETQLTERSVLLFPILKRFCCTGLTQKFPPAPISLSYTPIKPLSASNLGRTARNKVGKSAKGPNKRTELSATSNRHVYLCGLAWRLERRRAKLATRVLLCLYNAARRFRSSPKVPTAEVRINNAEEESEKSQTGDDESESGANLEKKVKRVLDEIVETCLSCKVDSANYVTCLTTLSRIALQLPGVYNRELKRFMTKTLVQNVLAREDEESSQSDLDFNPPSTTSGKKNIRKANTAPSPANLQPSYAKSNATGLRTWLEDGYISQATRAKISAVKLMTNWLRGLKNEVKPVAQAVIRLLHRIIIHEGDLTRQGKLIPGEMSRMRLVAALSWIRLAHSQAYVENIEVDWYQSMTYILCDPCPQVRLQFLNKLNQGLIRFRLPLEYIAMFAHAADVQDTQFRQTAKQMLAANVQRRRDFLDRHPSYLSDGKYLYGLLPEFVLPYLIYLLAHDPEWTDLNDIIRLNRIKLSLWFVMDPIVARGYNFSFLRKIIEKIKYTRDALAPDDQVINTKLYTVCDIALGLLLTRCPIVTIKEYPVDVRLPKALFTTAPPDFENPDFAQLLQLPKNEKTGVALSEGQRKPLIQFTPTKGSRSIKESLIPPQLVKGKGLPVDLSDATSAASTGSPSISGPPETPTNSDLVLRRNQPLKSRQTILTVGPFAANNSPVPVAGPSTRASLQLAVVTDKVTQNEITKAGTAGARTENLPQVILGRIDVDLDSSPRTKRKQPQPLPTRPFKRGRTVQPSPADNPSDQVTANELSSGSKEDADHAGRPSKNDPSVSNIRRPKASVKKAPTVTKRNVGRQPAKSAKIAISTPSSGLRLAKSSLTKPKNNSVTPKSKSCPSRKAQSVALQKDKPVRPRRQSAISARAKLSLMNSPDFESPSQSSKQSPGRRR
ncbi:unnamed protein product [Calicophoron daubneyi]|uniref:SCD domain-containing protein n=1 Tax=Calicophoron daubneyi TaxID=300641 RepID=A0AAV2SZ15_CALDB